MKKKLVRFCESDLFSFFLAIRSLNFICSLAVSRSIGEHGNTYECTYKLHHGVDDIYSLCGVSVSLKQPYSDWPYIGTYVTNLFRGMYRFLSLSLSACLCIPLCMSVYRMSPSVCLSVCLYAFLSRLIVSIHVGK